MNNRFVINYTPGTTTLHKLNGKTKVLALIVLMVAIISTFDVRLMLPIFLLCTACTALMKPNWKPILIMLGILFVMNGVLISLLIWLIKPASGLAYVAPTEQILWQVNNHFYLSKELLWYVGIMFFKRAASFSVAITFILSITPSELAAGLNGIGLPYKAAIIFSLAFRTIPDIVRDFADIRNSMQMRGLELDRKKISLHKRLRQYVLMLIPLIISSFNKVETIANSMDLRGFGKHKGRTWYCEHAPSKADYAVRIFTAVLMVLTILYIVFCRNLYAPVYDYWCPWVPNAVSGYLF